MANCLPGMPCYQGNDVIVYTTYPKGCTSSSNLSNCYSYTLPLRSEDVYYSGPNLPYSGIKTEDTITTSLQKIDTLVNPTAILEAILLVLEENPELKTQLCSILSDCE